MSVLTSNLRALVNAKKFLPLMRGTELTMADGTKLFVKVKHTSRTVLSPGLRFSKWSFCTEIQSCDVIEFGNGEDDCKLLAYEKSIAESLERLIFRITKNMGVGTKTTSGWSFHLTESLAQNASFQELAERDAILVHWLREIPMTEIAPVSFPRFLQNWVRNELSLHKTFRHLRILATDKGILPAIATVLQTESGHSIVSHSTCPDMLTAVKRALAETCRLASNIDDSHFFKSSKNLLTGTTDGGVAPQDHGLLYAYHAKLPEWLFGETMTWREAHSKWKSAFASGMDSKINFNFRKIIDGPFVVGFGESEDLQQLYFGSTDEALKKGYINLERLEIDRGAGSLNLLPHFIA